MWSGLGQRSALRCVLQRPEKRIRQCHDLNVAGLRIRADRRIDPETQWEIHRLAGCQSLLVEAEACGLVKILCRFFRRDVVERDPCNRGLRLVVRGVGCEVVLAQRNGDFELVGSKGPGQTWVNVGIETHPDGVAVAAGCRSLADFWCAAITGRLTERAIEWNGSKRQAHHADRNAGKDTKDQQVAAALVHSVDHLHDGNGEKQRAERNQHQQDRDITAFLPAAKLCCLCLSHSRRVSHSDHLANKMVHRKCGE
jgi:hypothetical protein